MLRACTLVRQLSHSSCPTFTALLHTAARPQALASRTAFPSRVSRPGSNTRPVAASQRDRLLFRLGFLYDKVNGSVARAVINDKSSPVHGMASANAALPAPRLLSEATEAQPDFRSRSPPSIPVSSGALIEDSDHSLRAKSIPMMTLRIVARLRSAGEARRLCSQGINILNCGVFSSATSLCCALLFQNAMEPMDLVEV